MTNAHASTIRVPWLGHGLRRRTAAQARPRPADAGLLPRRHRRMLGVGLTTAGAATMATSAAGAIAAPGPGQLTRLVLASLATAAVAHCTAAAGRGDGA